MFKFLSKVDTTQLIRAVHYTILFIMYRENADVQKNYKIRGFSAQSSDRELAGLIVREIEKVEGRPLKELKKAKAAKYIQKLTDMVDRRIKQELNYNKNKGKELLKKLRQPTSTEIRPEPSTKKDKTSITVRRVDSFGTTIG